MKTTKFGIKIPLSIAALVAGSSTALAQYTPPTYLTDALADTQEVFTWAVGNVFVVLFVAVVGLGIVVRMIKRGLRGR